MRETRDLTVDGHERDASWIQGVGIYVSGHDFGKGDTVLIEEAPHELTEMRRMQMEGEAMTLIVQAKKTDSPPDCRSPSTQGSASSRPE